jgi:SHS2 domain-containing protein
MMPRSITGLRHEWTHPALDRNDLNVEELPKVLPSLEEAREWMENLAKNVVGCTYDEIIDLADRFHLGEYVMWEKEEGEVDSGGTTLRDVWYGEGFRGEFAKHYQAITGNDLDIESSGGFTCSC